MYLCQVIAIMLLYIQGRKEPRSYTPTFRQKIAEFSVWNNINFLSGSNIHVLHEVSFLIHVIMGGIHYC